MGRLKHLNFNLYAVDIDTMKLFCYIQSSKTLCYKTFLIQKKHDGFVSKPSC